MMLPGGGVCLAFVPIPHNVRGRKVVTLWDKFSSNVSFCDFKQSLWP